MDISSSESTDSCDSCDSTSSLLDELQELVEHCQGLHRHHDTALQHLSTIQALLVHPMTIHYQCEDHDFGTFLESLHAQALEEIDQGGAVSFGQLLLDRLAYSSFSP